MSRLEVYYIYSMKKQVARHYYYKSDLLFRFLATCEWRIEQEDIMKQFMYVTHTIQARRIIQFIQNMSHTVTMNRIGEHDFIFSNGVQTVRLSMHDMYIQLTCPSIYDAEQLVFQPLRSFPNDLFVVHSEKHVYGWISIVKSERSTKSRQAL